ncbi:DUF5689 domain-containing protein [Myroides sp. TSA_177.3]|uniref:DUF5689 domain-containing protein n=1 Tax=Myroides sp. TSA_177.3 TaxID=3415650 RepID=UPI0040456E66
MKTILKSIFFTVLTALFVSSCAKNDDFSVPSLKCEEPQVTITKTIDDLYSTIKGNAISPYMGDSKDILRGVVVSSNKGGNFHNKLHVLDEKTQSLLLVNLDKSDSYAAYPPGTIIYVKLGGLYLQNNDSIINIGGGINGQYISNISKNAVNAYIGKYCTKAKIEDYTIKLTVAELLKDKGKYKGKLVTVTDVQFDPSLVGKKLYDAKEVDAQGQTLRAVVDNKDNTFNIRTSTYANDFHSYEIPAKSGNITGIYDIFNKNVQFYPRVIEDLDLTKDPLIPDDGGPVEPGKFLAFPGADFEKWDDFLRVIFNNQLSDPTGQKAEGQGWKNSTGLAIKGSREQNGYLFSVQGVKMPKDATKLSFLMKGTSERSLSINIHRANGINYKAYNLENVTRSKIVVADETPMDNNPDNTTNKYNGKIDTQGKWVKITLDLTSFNGQYHTEGTRTFISFKNGNKANYDLVIDEIRFEDGTPVEDDGGPVDPVDPEPTEADMLTNFNNWDEFTSKLSTHGLKSYATQAPGEGRNGKAAMKLSGTTTANDFVFTINGKQVPEGKTKLVLWVKGTSDKKSLSFNVNKPAGGYDPFNAGFIASTNLDLVKATANQYNGTIDTGGQWVKLTLDLSDTAYNSTGSGDVFSLKTGSGSTYELLIDSIYFQ